jgi:anaerobic selenocysteine-containing dehydrogenase
MVMERSLDDLLGACGCSLDDARTVRDLYSARRPAATIIGTGLQRYRFGGENVRFINALAFVSGNIGVSGGGSFYHMNSLRNLNLSWTGSGSREGVRFLRMPLIGREIVEAENPPIKMLWLDGSNVVNQAPGAMHTARALEQVGFTVVVDAFMTDTAARADLVLPCAIMLEQEDLVASYMHDYVQYAAQALEPRGEARSDFAILSELGRRLDPPVLLPEAQECLRESLRSPFLDTTLEEIKEKGFVRALHPAVAYRDLVFDHEDGAYRFPPELHAEPDPPVGYPLRLLSLIRRDATHSQILPGDQRIPPEVWVSRDDPALGGIDRHRPVALVTPLGRMRVVLNVTEDLRPGVVLYRRGDWMRLGGGVNRIIEPRLTDMGTGTAYYDQYARIEND